MPPFYPVLGISRSQNVRLGKTLVPQMSMGSGAKLGFNPQTGAFEVPAYIDLSDPLTRRDYQRHSALGAILEPGALSTTVTSDLFWATPPVVTVTYPTATVPSTGILRSRSYGNSSIAIPGGPITVASNTGGAGSRIDLIVARHWGTGVSGVVPAIYSLIQGVPGGAAPATPANYTAVGTITTTTANVSTYAATGPTS